MSAPALIHDPATHKLGRKPRVPTLAAHLKRAKFAELLKTLSPAPPVDNSSFLTGVGMLGNDVLSDCTSAAKGDLLRLWTGANGTPFNPTTEEAIEFYKISTGYDGTPATDQGGNMDVVADAFKTVGWAGHKISDDRVLPRTIEALHQGLFRYGAVDCGWNLPTNAQTQSVWTLDLTAGADGDPGSWGGHDAFICGFDSRHGPLEDLDVERREAGDLRLGALLPRRGAGLLVERLGARWREGAERYRDERSGDGAGSGSGGFVKRVALIALTWALGGCATNPPPAASCATACSREVDLNCGATFDECMQRCAPVASQLSGYPACVAAAPTCPQVRLCQ